MLRRIASRGEAIADRPAIDADAPRGELGHAEGGEEEILLAHALQAGDAEDLAPVQVKLDARRAFRPTLDVAGAENLGGPAWALRGGRESLRDASGR